MKVEEVSFPKRSILIGPTYDYTDSFQVGIIDKEHKIDPIVAAKALFSSSPKWISNLLNIRNRIVSIFGLKTGDKPADLERLMNNFQGEIGESIGLFKVYNKTANELVMGENDKHLDFRVSLFLERVDEIQQSLIMTTTVVYNNWFGRFYFFFVKPFHKLIVPTMLKGIVREVEKGELN